MSSPSYSFIAGDRGSWEVQSMVPLCGAPLEQTPFMEIRNEYLIKVPVDFCWLLRGVSVPPGVLEGAATSGLMTGLPQIGRKDASCAAFIPVKRCAKWWRMSDEERLAIFDRSSRNGGLALSRISAIARQFHHSRELGEPFDFLTWFEFAPEDCNAFDEALAALRESEEWQYVEREIDVRLVRRKTVMGRF